jgi:hypothetical protein
LGFPTGWSFTRHQALFLAPLPGRKKKTSARGVFRMHILYFVLSFALLYLFYLHHFIKNPKKLESFVVVFTCLLLVSPQYVPFEQYMGILKHYCRNMYQFEARIVEGYITEEVVAFCTD